MIAQDYQNFFLATSGASAALIGLLFVAVSVAPEKVVGPKALALHEVRANMALAAFSSTLVLSLVALLPRAHIGWPATLIGAGGALFCYSSLRRLRAAEGSATRRHALVLLLVFGAVMVFLLTAGIRSLVDPHNLDPVTDAGIAVIGLIAIGIDRSWELVGGREQGLAGLLTKRVDPASRSAMIETVIVAEGEHVVVETADVPARAQ